MWSTGYSASSALKPVQYVLRDGTVAAATAWSSTLLGPEGTGMQLSLNRTGLPRRGFGGRRTGTARILRTA